jgi:radical SAM superfamily enzyme YgiQ (UPF0313 family)
VDNVDPALLQLMARAGCWLIGYGIESGCQEVLDRANKKIDVATIKSAINMAHNAGITVVGHVIIGLPGDTEETIMRTIDFVTGSGLDFAQFYCAVPFPGSKLYDEAVGNNWLNSNDWSRFEQNQSVLSYPGLSSERIEMLRRLAIRRFYLKPRAIKSLYRTIKEHGDILSFFRSLKEFISWI